MADRDWRRQPQEDCETAEQPLQDDRSECPDSKPADPAAVIDTPRPHREDDGEHADDACNHSMPMLVENSPDHLFEGEREHEMAVGVWPVWYGEPGTRARHHAPRGEQEDGARRH